MGSIRNNYALRQLFGIDLRTIKHLENQNIDFFELYDKLYRSKSLRNFRNVFYDLFRSNDIEENYIDKLWEKFVNNKSTIEEKIKKRKWRK